MVIKLAKPPTFSQREPVGLADMSELQDDEDPAEYILRQLQASTRAFVGTANTPATQAALQTALAEAVGSLVGRKMLPENASAVQICVKREDNSVVFQVPPDWIAHMHRFGYVTPVADQASRPLSSKLARHYDYTVQKQYGHDRGYSCVFQQHRAKSHCRLLHGYALAFTFVFGANELDENGWVVDFGGLKEGVKAYLDHMFDHTLLVAADHPQRAELERLGTFCLADIRIIEDGVGCERLAVLVGQHALAWVEKFTAGRATLVSATVAEHGANSASWYA